LWKCWLRGEREESGSSVSSSEILLTCRPKPLGGRISGEGGDATCWENGAMARWKCVRWHTRRGCCENGLWRQKSGEGTRIWSPEALAQPGPWEAVNFNSASVHSLVRHQSPRLRLLVIVARRRLFFSLLCHLVHDRPSWHLLHDGPSWHRRSLRCGSKVMIGSCSSIITLHVSWGMPIVWRCLPMTVSIDI